MRTSTLFLTAACVTFTCSSCHHEQEPQPSQEKELTVGVVHNEIKKGMSPADVAQVLGSPNIITRDQQGKETWIYDKISSEVSYTQQNGSITPGVGAAGSSVVGLIFGHHSKSSGHTKSTQKTLTVIIKFDENSLIESFATHATKF